MIAADIVGVAREVLCMLAFALRNHLSCVHLLVRLWFCVRYDMVGLIFGRAISQVSNWSEAADYATAYGGGAKSIDILAPWQGASCFVA
jgi:hypothetical protein